MSKQRRFLKAMKAVSKLQLPEICEANKDTVLFLSQVMELHGKYRANVLSAKTDEQAELYKFHVALTGKMMTKLAKLATFEQAVSQQ